MKFFSRNLQCFRVQNRSTFFMNGLITCVLVSNFADNIKSCIKAGSPDGYGSLRSRKIFGFENLEMQNTASVEYILISMKIFHAMQMVVISQMSFLEVQTRELFVHLK